MLGDIAGHMHSYEAARVLEGASLLEWLPKGQDHNSSPNPRTNAFTASTIGQRDFAGHSVPPPGAYFDAMARFGSVAVGRK